MKNIFENILFGVAREDHKIEASLIEKNNYKNLLTVCSGGCVPLSLKTIFPDLNVVAYDINPNQIDHCKKKKCSFKEGLFFAKHKPIWRSAFKSIRKI